MAEKENTASKRITIEDGKIIIESTNKAWLDFIKNEILTKEIGEGSNNSSEERIRKFVGYCWKHSPMRNVLKTIAHARTVPFEKIASNYKSAFGKSKGLSGVFSGFTRNRKRAGLAENWLDTEHNGSQWNYSINEIYFSLIRDEVARRESKK